MGLVHATDERILEIAQNYNQGSLRVLGLPDYEPMYWARGVNGNPQWPPSNPAAIAAAFHSADAVEVAASRRKARTGIEKFLLDLARGAEARDDQALQEQLEAVSYEPSGRAVMLLVRDERALTGEFQWISDCAEEFRTGNTEAISPQVYEVLRAERHAITDGRYSCVYET